MYKNTSRAKGDFYFQYAPPNTRERDQSTDRPKPPYKGAPGWKCSVYYYWWAYLRENADYIRCCEMGGRGKMSALFKDFGDVRKGNFVLWWRTHGREIFAEPQESRVRVLNAHEAIEAAKTPKFLGTASPVVFIQVPLSTGIDKLMDDIRTAVTPHLKSAGRYGSFRSRARREVHELPVLTALETHLRVWQARREHPDVTLYELGKIVGLVSDPKSRNDADVKASGSVIVSRHLKKARNLIHNAGEGRFPDLSDPRK